ncbi:MAG TPA: hypothetical protein VL752_09925 [Acidisoma sp.]|jgi:hypothetical protein|uniref:hypothetical protein n=1 Tax=Acidisoma sp. TaxID=1872115 RepID=UPI002BFF2647|nr:hypothetical protein [Acidisoma sp.]HTI01248.1 hypothetical protein [Acidisoma sp.]
MRPDGSFVEKPREQRFAGWPPPPPPRGGRLARNLTIAAVIAGSVVVAGLALSLALVLVPVMIGAALIGYAALRFQLWRMRKNGGAGMAGPFGAIMAQMDAVMRARRQGR